MVPILKNLANPKNYGAKRDIHKIKLWFVIHYTANDGDHDEGNASYFRRDLKAEGRPVASAHIFVDDDSATISVPIDYVAYSVGGSKYSNCKDTGGGRFYGVCTNQNSINLEMCDTLRNGKLQASLQTMKNAAEIAAMYMDQYDIPMDRLIRHFDVTGKLCPAYLVDEKAWSEFKKAVKKELEARHEPGERIEDTKYRITRKVPLRYQPHKDDNKVQYSELSVGLKQKCVPDDDGYAYLSKGATVTAVRRYKIGEDTMCIKIKSGYWFFAEWKGIKHTKSV